MVPCIQTGKNSEIQKIKKRKKATSEIQKNTDETIQKIRNSKNNQIRKSENQKSHTDIQKYTGGSDAYHHPANLWDVRTRQVHGLMLFEAQTKNEVNKLTQIT